MESIGNESLIKKLSSTIHPASTNYLAIQKFFTISISIMIVILYCWHHEIASFIELLRACLVSDSLNL
jgi:hypothetical protein